MVSVEARGSCWRSPPSRDALLGRRALLGAPYGGPAQQDLVLYWGGLSFGIGHKTPGKGLYELIDGARSPWRVP